MRFAAYSFVDPPRITNEQPDAPVSAISDLGTPAMRSLPKHHLKHISKKNLSWNILKCLFSPRVVSNGLQTHRPNSNTPKRIRISQHVLLCKYSLLIARDTVFRRKRSWIARDSFISSNLQETQFNVKEQPQFFPERVVQPRVAWNPV